MSYAAKSKRCRQICNVFKEAAYKEGDGWITPSGGDWNERKEQQSAEQQPEGSEQQGQQQEQQSEKQSEQLIV